MALSRLEILTDQPYANGREFGAVGPYRLIDAIAHYTVDPNDLANRAIVDLALAERGEDGLVHFQGDMTLLLPEKPEAANRALLMQVPNRGKRVLARFNQAPMTTADSADIDPGDGFLFHQGWTICWAGWQWDVPRRPERFRSGLAAPQVPFAARGDEQMQLRLQVNSDTADLPLTDQHVGDLGRHMTITAMAVEDPKARLLVRDGPYGEAREIPRQDWRFARLADDQLVPDADHVWLRNGFEAGRIYDLLYTPANCPVVGAGLLATRDCASYLRFGDDAPTLGRIDHVVAEGQSQCGRFLRTFLYFGLNRDEAQRQVFDGMLIHIAGARRGEFNHRHAQPSVQPTPSFGHLFPFADQALNDPFGADREGLLDRQTAIGGLPKIFYTDTSSEYWRGDAGLSHTDPGTGDDLQMAEGVRRYLFSSTQHGPGVAALAKRTLFGSHGANHLNMIDYRPLYRAALTNLLTWIVNGAEPPQSAYPERGDDNRRSRAEVMEQLAAIPGMNLPQSDAMTTMHPLDLGPRSNSGIAQMPAVVRPESYFDWVSAVDPDGNEIAGLRMPDVTVPVASHTGFNPRHPKTGAAGQLLEYIGSTVPFAATQEARLAQDDPRPSLAERYRSREDYLAQVRQAAEALVEQRYLLADDVALCIDLAAARYDVCAGGGR